jgi:hypothetical protein
MLEEPNDIQSRLLLGIGVKVLWDVRRWITPGIEGDHLIAAGEVAHLWFPTAVISGEFMDQEQRITTPGYLIVQIYTIDRSLGHACHPLVIDPPSRLSPIEEMGKIGMK